MQEVSKRPLLIGQAPARAGDGRAFTGASGNRLRGLLALPDWESLDATFKLLNVFPWPLPKRASGKGDEFPIEKARQHAMMLRGATRNGLIFREIWPNDAVILCGTRVWKAFQLPSSPEPLVPYLIKEGWDRFPSEGLGYEGWWAYMLPHPSGVNRWWNEPENVASAQRFLKAMASAQGVDAQSGLPVDP
jgi:uracil-DNA glycosylase